MIRSAVDDYAILVIGLLRYKAFHQVTSGVSESTNSVSRSPSSDTWNTANDRMDDPFCVGTYSVRDGRAWLRPERGWCNPIKIFDAAFEVDDEELRFDPDTFRGEVPYLFVFAARPLERIS